MAIEEEDNESSAPKSTRGNISEWQIIENVVVHKKIKSPIVSGGQEKLKDKIKKKR